MSDKGVYSERTDVLRHTGFASNYIEREICKAPSPFLEDTFFAKWCRRFLLILLSFVETLLGQKLYIESPSRELSAFDRSNRSLLQKLLKEGWVTNWDCKQKNDFKQGLFFCQLHVAKNFLERTGSHMRTNLAGYGASTNLNQALKIAIAETIERIAASDGTGADIVESKVSHLKENGRAYFIKSFYTPQVDSHAVFNWTKADDILTGKNTWLPSSTIFLFPPPTVNRETQLCDVNTNGVAAHVTKEKALTGALYELFERDGLLMYWLNRLAPNQIDLTTLVNQDVLSALEKMKKHNCNFHLLDCKTEYGIPVVVSVLIDNINGGVYVNAASGLNVDSCINKVIVDSLRLDSSYKPKRPTFDASNITNMKDRRRFWQGGFMRDRIDWFLEGKKVSYQDYKSQFGLAHISEINPLSYIKSKLKENKSDAFYYSFKSKLAKDAGLFVVRAIVPDLMPIYFNESKKHLNVPRLYSFARKMSFNDRDISREELNPIPHPFI